MGLKIVNDGSMPGDVQENCCMCRKPTSWWWGTGTRNVALCPYCAKTTKASKLPTKEAWCAKERKLKLAGSRTNLDGAASLLPDVLGVGSARMHPNENKFHAGNGEDGKHYWLTPPDLYAELDMEFKFDFDPCPFPKPEDFDGLTCEWGHRNWVNPPFGSIIHQGRKKGPTAWMRKAIEEQRKGKLSVVVYPVDKWVLMMLAACRTQNVRNLGDVKWCATEDGSTGNGTGRHIAAFILTHNAK